ncbi:unnamed protein product, partial [Urochloa humidicola]
SDLSPFTVATSPRSTSWPPFVDSSGGDARPAGEPQRSGRVVSSGCYESRWSELWRGRAAGGRQLGKHAGHTAGR